MNTMKDFLRDERGSILPIMAAAIVILLAIAAIAVDFARSAAAAEKLKSATEAAALAGAASGDRYVKLLIDPGNYVDCCPSANGGCTPCCRKCGDPFEVTGTEKELIDNVGWKKYQCNCGGGSMKILDRWVEYKGNNAESAVELFFYNNIPKEMDTGQGGDAWISNLTVHKDRSDPHYPTVTVEATGKVKTLFLNFLSKIAPSTDFSYLKAKKCTQSETRYYELNGKFVKTATEDCD